MYKFQIFAIYFAEIKSLYVRLAQNIYKLPTQNVPVYDLI